MIIDNLTTFCDTTSFVAEAGTSLLGNVYDLGASGQDPGNGESLYLVVIVTTAATDGGDSATMTFKLVSDAQAAIATDGTATVHLQSPALLKARMAVGQRMVFSLPTEGNTFERYLGILGTVATAGFDAGKVTIFLSKDPTGWKSYPDNQH